MEPQKRAQYSKLIDAEEMEEILMVEESQEELQELQILFRLLFGLHFILILNNYLYLYLIFVHFFVIVCV
jgi:hypothetical protein